MGLIGWANNIDSDESAVYEREEAETALSSWGELDATEIVQASSMTNVEHVEKSLPNTVADELDRDNSQNVTEIDRPMASVEVIEAIRQLKLWDTVEEDSCCDISQFELHEIEFILEHAEKVEKLDYYALAREVHAVKHRLLGMAKKPDSVLSPNLDSLATLLEEKSRMTSEGK